ncbi:MAG: dihydroorotase [Prevotella sp.]|nr:dihydroorotase [Prevotella sp.]
MNILISGGTIVNEGKTFQGSVLIADGIISDICEYPSTPRGTFDTTVDATGCFVLPGVIDTHVHFREPGLTHKADIESESRAAAAGGVTTVIDMPNTLPQTTTPEDLENKFELGKKCHVNYSFFYGATNSNVDTFRQLDHNRIPGVKLFMGSSTGNMLVDSEDALDHLFAEAARLGLIVMAHCEDSDIIAANMYRICEQYGDDPDVAFHPAIRSAEACLSSTKRAVQLARRHHARLHVAHISTAAELSLFEGSTPLPTTDSPTLPDITAEAVVGHLLFTDEDYSSLGTRIKCNPAIKTPSDRAALRRALASGVISTVATDHAPHLLSEKEGGCRRAASGMPMVQFSLPAMLGLVGEGIISIERLAELMSHAPARLFAIDRRGFLRKGYHADIAIVRPRSQWTIDSKCIESKCHWSPLEGRTMDWRVEKTFVGGRQAYDGKTVDCDCHGSELRFLRRQ